MCTHCHSNEGDGGRWSRQTGGSHWSCLHGQQLLLSTQVTFLRSSLSLSLFLSSLPPSVSSIYILLLKSVKFYSRKGGRVVLIGLPKVFTLVGNYCVKLCEDILFAMCSALFAYRAELLSLYCYSVYTSETENLHSKSCILCVRVPL